MTLLLAALAPHLPPRLPLGILVSPLEEHPELAVRFGLRRLLVKREDLNGEVFGGNKLRGIEWLLPIAAGNILTMGGYGSTWCAAVASAAASSGRVVHAALFPQPWSAAVAGALSTTLASAVVTLARSRWTLPIAIGTAWRGARRRGPVTWLPAGGATPLAVLGTVNAALEFVSQAECIGGPRPEAIVVPLGSGGTAAGLLVGMWLSRSPVDICAVRVTDPWFATRRRVLELARRTTELLAASGVGISPGRAQLHVVEGQLGGGYGHSTPAAVTAQTAMADAGIVVDLTYGAKACAALDSLAGSFRHLCFWHTFDPRLAISPGQELPLLRLARGHTEKLWPLPKST